jgi:hypothetical protein
MTLVPWTHNGGRNVGHSDTSDNRAAVTGPETIRADLYSGMMVRLRPTQDPGAAEERIHGPSSHLQSSQQIEPAVGFLARDVDVCTCVDALR